MTTKSIGDVASSFYEVVEERKKIGGVDVFGVATGFYRLDEYLGGLQPDALYLVGGRPGMGKTALGLDIALNVARQNKRVMVYSLEMTAARLTNRLLSRMTDIPSGRIVRGKLDGDELRKVKIAAEELGDVPLAITDETFDSERLMEHSTYWAERATKGGGPDLGLLVIDYVSLLRDAQKFGENERVGRISNNIRALARPDHLNIPIVLLVQLNRQVDSRDGHIPTLSDIRDSGSLEQDADAVVFCFRPYYYERLEGAEPMAEERDAALIVAKNREGPTGKTKAVFRASRTQWVQERPEGVDPDPVKKSLKSRVREKH